MVIQNRKTKNTLCTVRECEVQDFGIDGNMRFILDGCIFLTDTTTQGNGCFYVIPQDGHRGVFLCCLEELDGVLVANLHNTKSRRPICAKTEKWAFIKKDGIVKIKPR